MNGAFLSSFHPGAADHVRLLTEVGRREQLTVAQMAYVVATAGHESHLGRWMVDPTTGWQDEGRLLLGNTEVGDGERFRARGYVRLVGRTSYRQWSRHLDLDLMARPDLAAVPEVAAEILVLGMKLGRFTDRALGHYINESSVDYVGARQVMARTDHPVRVAELARRFERLLDGVGPGQPTTTDVKRVQFQLRQIGWPLAVDGRLGPFTRRAIRHFQQGYTLAELPTDGHPDPLTELALRRCVSEDGRASEHFRFAEFKTGEATLSATNCVIRVERRLIVALERLREQTGGPVRIDTGYRSIDENQRLGGRPDSEHVTGRAVHLRTPELGPAAVMAIGGFASIGHRDGVAVHLGVGGEEATTGPNVYPLQPIGR